MRAVVLGLPSKGRLMEATLTAFEQSGLKLTRAGSDRGYRAAFDGVTTVEVALLAASEIAQRLKQGDIDAGVTGEDLLRETIAPPDDRFEIVKRFDFGYADVVVAVPMCWLDVAQMSDLDEVAEQFYRAHGRRVRVATKYKNLTRRFFDHKGVTGYRVVESLGATEGAPAAGSADVIVDITTTGSTLAANHLKVLDDGVLLKSCAVLVANRQSSAGKALRVLLGT